MLQIKIPAREFYNEKLGEFMTINEQTLQLEHSLVSLSKWESKWNVPFLNPNEKNGKSYEQTIDYIRCMTVSKNVDPMVYYGIPNSVITQVNNYVEAPMTATTFGGKSPTQRSSREIITSEIIYYWMVALNIPFECQKWHLNRLLTLIKVCNIKNNADSNKMSKSDLAKRNRALNASRIRKSGGRG